MLIARTTLALVLAATAAVCLIYAAVMFDRAIRGYQDSDDRVYLTVAAASLMAAIITGALSVYALRAGHPTKRS